MALLHFRSKERRRTARVTLSMSVQVHGKAGCGEKFTFRTRTVTVSGHGGMIVLEDLLAVGQIIEVTNVCNERTARAKIVSARTTRDGKVHGAFEFVDGGEKFWSMAFPVAGAKPLRRLLPRAANG
jgi:c-di-GMP-binding flagellar brake protein YcgR